MSRHKSFAKIWLAYWLVKPMVPCRKFLGRAKTHDSGARPPSDRAQPSGRTLTCKGSEPADWAASQPPCLAPPDGPGRGAQPARSPTSPCQGGTERAGRVATLTSPSTVTSLRNPMRARGGAARARPARGGVEGRATSTSRRASRRHAADGARAPPPRSKQIQCRRGELPIAHSITNVTREPKGKGSATRPAALKNTKGCGAGRILAACRDA